MSRTLAVLAALLLAACADTTAVNAGDSRLVRSGPLMLLDGEPLTGMLLRPDASGRMLARLPYRDGLLHGIAREWYADGRIRSERLYVEGRKTGLHRGWWPSGRLQFEYRFTDGEHAGLARRWYPSGARFEEHRYRHGQEDGLQQLWHADGTLRASYEVRDGRRFGTIGSKPCLTEVHAGGAS